MGKKKGGSGIWKYIPEFQINEKFEMGGEDGRLYEFVVLEKLGEDQLSITLKVLTEGGDRVQRFFKRTKVQAILPEVIEPTPINMAPMSPKPRSLSVRGVSIE